MASGLTAGTYTATVTDANGCKTTRDFTITIASITSSGSQTNVSCNGGTNGSASVIPSGGTAPYTYLWSHGGTSAMASGLAAGNYTVTVTDANGCTATRDFTITQTTNYFTATIDQPANGIGFYNDNCNKPIAKVQSNGLQPISGNTTAKVWIDANQNASFVKRHYEITPVVNASDATGKVTLYFTQADFTAFNANNPPKQLPINGDDLAGNKANLLIEKRGGTGGENGFFWSYPGAPSTITPAGNDIIWNNTSGLWEVSFNVEGFSGFFVKTQMAPLPVYLLSFNGKRDREGNKLQWKTEAEVNASHFEIERSFTGHNFEKIGILNAKSQKGGAYQYYDLLPVNSTIYYRLKMVDLDDSFAYSRAISLASIEVADILISPNPVTSHFSITVSDDQLRGTEASIYSINGMMIGEIKITSGRHSVDGSLWPSGLYLVRFANGKTYKLVKK